MGSKGRTYKGLPQDPPIAGMAKKRTISTSLLETQVWETLNFLFAPSGGEKRMQLWLVIYTSSPSGHRRYLSPGQGDLQGTRVSLPSNVTQTLESIKEICWEQLQVDLLSNIG
jgi:hypothetical protein